MDRIFVVSREGKLTEYETLEHALAANEFAIVRFEPAVSFKRYQFLNSGDFQNALEYKGWKLRLNDVDRTLRCHYNIIDKHGIIQHYCTSQTNFDGLREMVVKFAKVTQYHDFKDEELHQREQIFKQEKQNLQSQIDALKIELETLKQKVGL